MLSAADDGGLAGSLHGLALAAGPEASAGTGAGVSVEYENTLARAHRGSERPQLFLSVWLRDPGEAANYTGIFFTPGPALGGLAKDPIPVLVDSCTMTFLRSRSVAYLGQRLPDDQIVIRAVRATLPLDPVQAGAEPPIDLDLRDFLKRYLGERKRKVLVRTLPHLRADVDETA